MTELEEKVWQIRLRINKLKFELKDVLEEKTDKEKAVFVYDEKDPHLINEKVYGYLHFNQKISSNCHNSSKKVSIVSRSLLVYSSFGAIMILSFAPIFSGGSRSPFIFHT